jgi:hypothetical protein
MTKYRRALVRLKRPHVATLDEVAITREDDGAVIATRTGPSAPLTSGSGPEVHRMTDREILDRFNAGIRATEAFAADYRHVAVEIPPGRPQIAYFLRGDQWTPQGDVLRCVIDVPDDRLDEEPEIEVREPTVRNDRRRTALSSQSA